VYPEAVEEKEPDFGAKKKASARLAFFGLVVIGGFEPPTSAL
jgi:hypothetical protein